MKLEIGTRIRALSDALPYYRAGETGVVADPRSDAFARWAEGLIGPVDDVWVQFDREKTPVDDGFWIVSLDDLEVLNEV